MLKITNVQGGGYNFGPSCPGREGSVVLGCSTKKGGGGSKFISSVEGGSVMGMTQCIRSILTFEQQKRPYLKVGDEARKGLYPKWWSIPLQLTPIIIIGETN